MTKRRKLVLLCLWSVSFLLGSVSAAIFVQGIARDHRLGEPVIDIDLSRQTGWLAAPFRIFDDGEYRLILSSVNHDTRLVGRAFEGRLAVQVAEPEGRLLLERIYDPAVLDYRVPSNYGDRTLETLALSAWPLRPWTLRVRVLDGDADFQTVRSELKLWKVRYEPAMGGLINYAMIVPAGVFLLLAALVASPLAGAGVRTPLIATGLILGALLLLVG